MKIPTTLTLLDKVNEQGKFTNTKQVFIEPLLEIGDVTIAKAYDTARKKIPHDYVVLYNGVCIILKSYMYFKDEKKDIMEELNTLVLSNAGLTVDQVIINQFKKLKLI